MKSPKTGLRPTLGIGVLLGAFILLATQASGSDPALGAVLGGGAGIALGLTRRRGPEALLPTREADRQSDLP